MGRFYNGDIEGKFWFAVQSSEDADFFGVTGYQPEYLEYQFEEEDLKGVEEGLKQCLKDLGEYKAKFDKYWKEHDSYRDETIAKEWKIPVGKVQTLLKWYARYELGVKIRDSIKKIGQCYFEAEC